jgi:uncharacterized protein YqhQ
LKHRYQADKPEKCEGTVSKPTYGGQAVIEGVMMRGQRDLAVAVRRPNGDVLVHSEPLNSAIYTSRLAKLPFIRGLVMLWDSLVLGTRILMFSANVAIEDTEEGVTKQASELEETSLAMWGSVIFGLVLAVGLFFVLPVLLVGIVDSYLTSSFWSNLVEKVFRLALFLGYIFAMGFIPDVRRVFAYHGAEHKTINAYEDGAPLEPESVSRYSTSHPRCGSSFLIIVFIISFVCFLLLGQPPLLWRILSRIVLIPVVAGVAYEFLKLGAAHSNNRFVKILLVPGMAVQKMTTREPDLSMLEVAIASLKRVLAIEEAKQGEQAVQSKTFVVGAVKPVITE